MRKRKRKNWLVELYEENKLYIWVVVGVLVISGVTIGITVGKTNSKLVPNNADMSLENKQDNIAETNTTPIKEEKEDTEKTKDKQEKIIQSKNIKDNNKVEKKTKVEENDNQIKEEKEEEKKENKKLEFIMPIENGKVIKDFSNDTLIYSNTLEEWVNHTGIDIETKKAMPVKAIEEGEVVGVKQDPRYGYTIIIDHGQGYKSIYCNLSTLDMVFVGKIVEKGQVISGVGDTALFEIKDNPHLHLEVMYNDEYINPLDIIKEK